MISEPTGISLNIASLPVKKKKAKVSIAASSEPVKPILEEVKKPKTVKQKIPAKTSAQIPNEPVGILKKSKPAAPSSIWKKFKQANKSDNSVEPTFAKPIKKPVQLVKKKVKVKENAEIIPSAKVFSVSSKKTIKNSDVAVEKPEVQNTNIKSSDFKFLNSEGISEKPDVVVKKRKTKLKFSDEDELPSKSSFVFDHPKGEQKAAKSTSLFGNNPEIPNIPHRAVKPVKEAVFSSSNFEDMELHPYMVKYLKESMGLTKMTTVQEKSIPVLLEKQDALVRSQTGSGKTLAFALPILHRLQEIRPKINRSDGVLVLIVVPTRELALQTYEVFNKLVKSYTWIVPGYLVGGEKRKSEKARLRKGISILIGTPGRLLDHVKNTKALNLEKVSWLVIDEADRLLDMGYEKDVSDLLDALNQDDTRLLKPSYLNPEEEPKEKKQPRERQTVLLSATLTQKVQKLAGLSLKNPVFVDACDENLGSDHVPVFSSDMGNESNTMVLPESLIQKYVVTPPKLMLVTLTSFILWKSKLTKQKKMLIFIATQDMVDYFTELLSSVFSKSNEEDSDDEDASPFANCGIELFKLHGNMKQSERTEVFKTFRKSHFGVLLCTLTIMEKGKRDVLKSNFFSVRACEGIKSFRHIDVTQWTGLIT